MAVKTGQLVADQFEVISATGALVNADALPTGTLIVAGANNAAAVTITNIATGVYSWSVTLPALTAGQLVSLRIAATVDGVATGGTVWQETADTKLTSDLQDPTVAAIQSGLATAAALAIAELNIVNDIQGPGGHSLTGISGQIDAVQADLDDPEQYMGASKPLE